MSDPLVRECDGALVVQVAGPSALNDFRSTALRQVVYEAVAGYNRPLVALDLAAVEFLSSAGIALLIGVKRRIEQQGGRLVLFGVRPVVLDLLKVTRLLPFFQVAESESQALDLLRTDPTA